MQGCLGTTRYSNYPIHSNYPILHTSSHVNFSRTFHICQQHRLSFMKLLLHFIYLLTIEYKTQILLTNKVLSALLYLNCSRIANDYLNALIQSFNNIMVEFVILVKVSVVDVNVLKLINNTHCKRKNIYLKFKIITLTKIRVLCFVLIYTNPT